jgi:hypothetical protein
MRLGLCAAALVSLVGVLEVQPQGTVLTATDIEVPHLIARPTVVEGRAWLGLRVFDDSSRVERVDAAWVGSLEFEDSVFTLSTQPTGMTLLVADVPRIEEGPATTVTRFEETLLPGVGLRFALNSGDYVLQLGGSDPSGCDATVTFTDGAVSQELYFPDDFFVSCDEPHFSVQWAGDLDGDGRLDLVTTLSPKYSFYPRRLYLSSAASDGMLVGLVAAFDAAAA